MLDVEVFQGIFLFKVQECTNVKKAADSSAWDLHRPIRDCPPPWAHVESEFLGQLFPSVRPVFYDRKNFSRISSVKMKKFNRITTSYLSVFILSCSK